MHTITAGIIRSICETDSDVLILNEIHWRELQMAQDLHMEHYHCDEQTKQSIQSSQSLLEEVLRLRGYHYSRVASHGDTPTMIATRKKVLSSKEVILSDNRSALCVLIESGSSCCWVVGTHLDAFDAEGRRNEIRTLLEQQNEANNNNNNNYANVPILIAGDFNQQRSKDYTSSEWKKVAGSADLRGVPLDDGVACILEKGGFKCILDDVKFKLSQNDNGSNSNTSNTSNDSNRDDENETNSDLGGDNNVLCNWNQAQPPPSTHWSGTTIDYTYYSNHNSPRRSDSDSDTTTTADTSTSTSTSTSTTNIAPHGVYVGRAGFSDHRMTVTDWTLTTNTNDDDDDDDDDDTATGTEPKRHIDKSFFFHHLPAGRHHSWLYYYRNNQQNQYQGRKRKQSSSGDSDSDTTTLASTTTAQRQHQHAEAA